MLVERVNAPAQQPTFEVVEVELDSTPARDNWRKLMQDVVTHFTGH
ncbi:hypothetical protein ACH41C_10700 [Streptomyces althioticus]